MPIDLQRVDCDLSFVPITDLPRDRALDVLAIRNEAVVRHNMYTSHEISLEEHFHWIERMRSSKDAYFYAVTKVEKIVGGVGISAINKMHRRAEWAFYLTGNLQGKGTGVSLEYKFVNKIFDEFDIDKLNCEVISFNEKVIRLHQKFGFQIEGVRRDHVIRDGVKFDAVLLGITKEEWRRQWV